jgi:hypothetical protein
MPVQETPEVQAARRQFFQAYDQQLRLIQSEQERIAASANADKTAGQTLNNVVSVYSENFPATPSANNNNNNNAGQQQQDEDSTGGDKKNPVDFKNLALPEPIAVPDGNSVGYNEGVEEDDEIENDAVVISADDEDTGSIPRTTYNKPPTGQNKISGQNQVGAAGAGQNSLVPLPIAQSVQPSYSFSIPVGQQQQPFVGQQQQQQPGPLGLQNFPGQQQPGGPSTFQNFAGQFPQTQAQSHGQNQQPSGPLGLQNFPGQFPQTQVQFQGGQNQQSSGPLGLQQNFPGQQQPGGPLTFQNFAGQFPQTQAQSHGQNQQPSGPLGLQNFPGQFPQTQVQSQQDQTADNKKAGLQRKYS